MIKKEGIKTMNELQTKLGQQGLAYITSVYNAVQEDIDKVELEDLCSLNTFIELFSFNTYLDSDTKPQEVFNLAETIIKDKRLLTLDNFIDKKYFIKGTKEPYITQARKAISNIAKLDKYKGNLAINYFYKSIELISTIYNALSFSEMKFFTAMAYVSLYLRSIRGDERALNIAREKLSKEEAEEIYNAGFNLQDITEVEDGLTMRNYIKGNVIESLKKIASVNTAILLIANSPKFEKAKYIVYMIKPMDNYSIDNYKNSLQSLKDEIIHDKENKLDIINLSFPEIKEEDYMPTPLQIREAKEAIRQIDRQEEGQKLRFSKYFDAVREIL